MNVKKDSFALIKNVLKRNVLKIVKNVVLMKIFVIDEKFFMDINFIHIQLIKKIVLNVKM